MQDRLLARVATWEAQTDWGVWLCSIQRSFEAQYFIFIVGYWVLRSPIHPREPAKASVSTVPAPRQVTNEGGHCECTQIKHRKRRKRTPSWDHSFYPKEQPFLYWGTNESWTGMGTNDTVRYREGQHRSAFVFRGWFSFQSISHQGPKATWTKEMEQLDTWTVSFNTPENWVLQSGVTVREGRRTQVRGPREIK